MAGTGFKTNLNVLSEALGRLEEAVNAQSELYPAIGETLVEGTVDRFTEQVGPDGKPWEKSPYKEGNLLLDTARLRNSITHQEAGTNIYVGTNVVYARIHQFGGIIRANKAKSLAFKVNGQNFYRKKVKIPARPFIGISREDKERIAELIADNMAEAVKE